ncbi:translational activator of cytochrome c oxidase 1 [Nasonia vitripennis]|uniref:Translational activator of cytochrome c oxidase 1 n=1 Tax=Nasonia vitripennis TaxID=7425 RepID=A0A7M7GC65_NASVI|nr:translational activator of cytochrome c oxidase 1 [Nasonia vitripennis]
MTSLLKFVFRHRNIVNYTECKRFAGHNKWSNIRHIKMARDSERASALQTLIKKMKIAIAEGKSAKPDENVKLARLIDQAKKNSLPMATIKNLLEKMQSSKAKGQTAVFESRGPSGCVVLIQLLSENIIHTKQHLNSHLRKTFFSPAELASENYYLKKGIVLTEVDGHDIDNALDDAIEIGAEDAEKCKEEEKEFLMFSCQASELMKVRTKLEDLNYKIIQADVQYIPQVFVELNDEDMELVSKLYERLNNVEEVVGIYSNIL